MKFFLAILILVLGVSAFASEDDSAASKNAADKIAEGANKVSDAVADAYHASNDMAFNSRKIHNASLLLSYSPLELLLPSKIGATAAWHADGNTLYELDYSYSSIKASIESANLSEMNETRISLLKRNFSSGAFHWFWGAHYNSTRASINPTLMNTAGGISDVITVQTLGLTFGFGHRWVFTERLSFGVDWFSWAQPFVILKKEAPFIDATTSEEYRDDVDTALKVIGYIPRWAAFKMYLGYSF